MKKKAKASKVRIISNVKVGKPDVDPGKPSHVAGVRQGNRRGNIKQKGIKDKGTRAEGKSTRSTGINPKEHEPIDPRMPNLSPA